MYRSWDIPDEATAFSFEDNTSTTSNAPIERSTSSSDGFLQYDGTRHSSLPLRVVKSREGHRDGKKEFTIKRSSFLYLSSPTTKHKRFKINRKKSINEINKSEQRIRPGWRTEQTSSPHGNLLRKKKRGRNNGRKKPEKNTDNEVHVFRPQHAMNLKKAEAIRSHPGGRKEAPTNATLEDLCSKMEDRCDHRCHVVNGKAVCLCFKGFKPVGLTKCSGRSIGSRWSSPRPLKVHFSLIFPSIKFAEYSNGRSFERNPCDLKFDLAIRRRSSEKF